MTLKLAMFLALLVAAPAPAAARVAGDGVPLMVFALLALGGVGALLLGFEERRREEDPSAFLRVRGRRFLQP